MSLFEFKLLQVNSIKKTCCTYTHFWYYFKLARCGWNVCIIYNDVKSVLSLRLRNVLISFECLVLLFFFVHVCQFLIQINIWLTQRIRVEKINVKIERLYMENYRNWIRDRNVTFSVFELLLWQTLWLVIILIVK